MHRKIQNEAPVVVFFSNQAAKRRITCKFISSKIDLNLSVGETESTVHMSNIANTL